ncbi:MAG: FkbM family methyltransferase [Bryobacterales bacterium]|nr:FkbM family methyltransferase [Bryobacterales bacterium]
MRALRLAGVGLLSLIAYFFLAQRPYAMTVLAKATGNGNGCPWNKLLASPWDNERLGKLRAEARAQIKPLAEDFTVGIRQFSTSGRPFWLRDGGKDMSAERLLEFVLAEQAWLSEIAQEYTVKPGDVVMDVGAHVGTFGDDALRRGASKVIMIEPDPMNVECIRRNFAKELAEGKVVLLAEGAWDTESTLEFNTGVANSGTGSFVVKEISGKTIAVRVRPIDAMLRDAGVTKLDFVKMDIEGAERHALAGARQTLAKFKPRLMLDAYHLTDDDEVLPKLITSIHPQYQQFCAVCAQSRHVDQRIAPYAIFFH